MNKTETINEQINQMLIENGIQVTPQHRLWAMEGLLEAWEEDPENSMEKSLWLMFLQLEIARLKIQTHDYEAKKASKKRLLPWKVI